MDDDEELITVLTKEAIIKILDTPSEFVHVVIADPDGAKSILLTPEEAGNVAQKLNQWIIKHSQYNRRR